MKKNRIFAYYLPQFHPIDENDEWWGTGFTEWTNVRSAKPLFPRHDQPRVPGDALGYYDLMEDESVLQRQVDLARSHGIEGFCYYYYHFAPGKRLLEKPVERMLASSSPDFPFCLMWANETWSRRWNGDNQDILIAQEDGPELIAAVAHDAARHFADARHTRVDGKPVFMIYRPGNFKEPKEAVRLLRKIWQEAYGLEVHLCGGLTRNETDPLLLGYDAAYEFPPHKAPAGCLLQPQDLSVNLEFGGNIYSYLSMVAHELSKDIPSFPCHPCVMLAWDNTARMGPRATVFHEFRHYAFYIWLRYAVKRSNAVFGDDGNLVFINAWNEWAEGTCLEPDATSGMAALKVVQAVAEDVPWAEFVAGLEDKELRRVLIRDMDATAKGLFHREIEGVGQDFASIASLQIELQKAHDKNAQLKERIEKLQKRRTTLEEKLDRTSHDLTKHRKSMVGRMVAPFMKLEHKLRRGTASVNGKGSSKQ